MRRCVRSRCWTPLGGATKPTMLTEPAWSTLRANREQDAEQQLVTHRVPSFAHRCEHGLMRINKSNPHTREGTAASRRDAPLRLPGRRGTTAQRWEAVNCSAVSNGAGYHAQDRIQQHRRQIEPLAFRSPVVRDLRKISKSDICIRGGRAAASHGPIRPSTSWRCNASLTIWATRLGVTRSSPARCSISPAQAQPRENALPPHRLAIGVEPRPLRKSRLTISYRLAFSSLLRPFLD